MRSIKSAFAALTLAATVSGCSTTEPVTVLSTQGAAPVLHEVVPVAGAASKALPPLPTAGRVP